MPRAQKKAAPAEAVDVDELLETYRAWLARQSLAARSREAYGAQVAAFLAWLSSSEHGGRALSDPHVRDWAARDYKRHMKTEARWAPASVNQALAAIDNFYRSLGAGRPDVPREDLPRLAPRALEEGEQRRFLRAVQASPSPRERAIATVFFYTALRLSELAALELADVSVTARRGMVRVRAGKGAALQPAVRGRPGRGARSDPRRDLTAPSRPGV